MKFLSRIYDFLCAPAGTFDSDPSLFQAADESSFSDSDSSFNSDEMSIINPATGMLMTAGIGGVDMMGSPYGVDIFSHDCGSTYDHGTSSFDSGSMFDSSSTSMNTGTLFD